MGVGDQARVEGRWGDEGLKVKENVEGGKEEEIDTPGLKLQGGMV